MRFSDYLLMFFWNIVNYIIRVLLDKAFFQHFTRWLIGLISSLLRDIRLIIKTVSDWVSEYIRMRRVLEYALRILKERLRRLTARQKTRLQELKIVKGCNYGVKLIRILKLVFTPVYKPLLISLVLLCLAVYTPQIIIFY